MAHLNLRDRIVEATIAYVGGSGEAALARVLQDVQRGRLGPLVEKEVRGLRVLALEWRPTDTKFQDCDFAVTLLSAASDVGAIDEVLVDADGLVLLLDADASASDRNARASATVKAALVRAGEKRVPVVVQVNGADEAIADVESLVAEQWPRVSASKGEGVMEALQRAVDAVVDSLQTQPAPTASPRPAVASRPESNPLLSALRQILQTALADQVAVLEERLGARMRETAAPLEERMEKLERRVSEETLAQREALSAEMHESYESVRSDVARAVTAAAALQRAVEDLSVEVGRMSVDRPSSDIVTAIDRLDAKSDGVRERIDMLLADVHAISGRLDEVSSCAIEADAETERRTTELNAAVKALGEELEQRTAVIAQIADEHQKTKKKGWF